MDVKFAKCNPRIVVIGDCGIDRDYTVKSMKPSQETTSPVWQLESNQPTERPAMAAATALMATALGAQVRLFGNSIGPRSIKTRYLDQSGRLLFRIDHDPAAEPVTLTDELKSAMGWADMVLVSDYGKGCCANVAAILAAAKCPTIVDPAPSRHWGSYDPRYVDCFKANRGEAEGQTHYHTVVTDAGGMALDGHRFPARPSKVVDTCGAGDMVLAALGVCIGGGMDWSDACRIANVAAGLKCERRGAVPVHKAEVLADLRGNAKLLDAETVCKLTAGKRVAFANGCFDLLHAGHVALLKEANRLADVLVVGLNSDSSVMRLKGDGRPRQPAQSRAAVLAALGCVDWIVEFDGETPAALVERIKPDVLVKGSDWRGKPVAGSEFAGKVHFVPLIPGLSTTRLLAG